MTEEEARALATHLGINYVETSAQTGQNVDAMFEDLYRRVLHSNRKNEGGEGHVHVDAGGIGEVKS